MAKAHAVAKTTGSHRFRVYFKGIFAGIVLADTQADAEALAPSLLSVRPVRS